MLLSLFKTIKGTSLQPRLWGSPLISHVLYQQCFSAHTQTIQLHVNNKVLGQGTWRSFNQQEMVQRPVNLAKRREHSCQCLHFALLCDKCNHLDGLMWIIIRIYDTDYENFKACIVEHSLVLCKDVNSKYGKQSVWWQPKLSQLAKCCFFFVITSTKSKCP